MATLLLGSIILHNTTEYHNKFYKLDILRIAIEAAELQYVVQATYGLIGKDGAVANKIVGSNLGSIKIETVKIIQEKLKKGYAIYDYQLKKFAMANNNIITEFELYEELKIKKPPKIPNDFIDVTSGMILPNIDLDNDKIEKDSIKKKLAKAKALKNVREEKESDFSVYPDINWSAIEED